MIKNRIAFRIAILSALTVTFTGCATASHAGSDPGATDNAYAHVDIKSEEAKWEGLEINVPDSVLLAELPLTTPEQLAESAELVVIGEVVEQGPERRIEYLLTNSQVRITEILKGDAPAETLELISAGSPPYFDWHVDIDGIGNPPVTGSSYVFYLTHQKEILTPDGLIPVENVWTVVGGGQYLIEGDQLIWEGEQDLTDPDVTLGTLTLDQARETLRR